MQKILKTIFWHFDGSIDERYRVGSPENSCTKQLLSASQIALICGQLSCFPDLRDIAKMISRI